MERGYNIMTANDVILRLVEMLLSEKDKNIQLQQSQDIRTNED